MMPDPTLCTLCPHPAHEGWCNTLLRIARAVIEFKCPTCEGERSINIYGAGWKKAIIGSRPCPTCTPLREAIGGLTE